MNPDTLKPLLAETFPDIRIRTLTKLGNGKAGEIFLTNGETVFKVPLTSDESDSDLRLEYEVLLALHGKVEITIPKPICIATLADGRTVLGESLVPGVQFTHDMFDSFTQPEKDALFAQMGDIFYQLHTAEIPQIKNAPVYGVKENLEYFYENYTDSVKKELTNAEQAKIDEILQNFITAVEKNPPPVTFTHGDVHFWNLNYDPTAKRICGILDFGIANYNDPINDIRYFWPKNVAQILVKYPADLGEGLGARHLFYNMCNMIDEANGELKRGVVPESVKWLKQLIYQEPLKDHKPVAGFSI
ncbi:MAG: aminoglycoside phosphotransferase family protein [Defluviitaleaceae bacterium]|nr:aminoglycoside phosphotransferase family protein [Defluviitaleaceae bacterium]